MKVCKKQKIKKFFEKSRIDHFFPNAIISRKFDKYEKNYIQSFQYTTSSSIFSVFFNKWRMLQLENTYLIQLVS